MLQFHREHRSTDPDDVVRMVADVGDYRIVARSEHKSNAWQIRLHADGCVQPITTTTIEPDADVNTPEHVSGVALERVLAALYGRATASQKVAAAISAAADDGEMERTYVAVVKSSACRDTQVASTPDATDAEMFVGLFTGTRDAVLNMASGFAGVHVGNIRLIPSSETRKAE